MLPYNYNSYKIPITTRAEVWPNMTFTVPRDKIRFPVVEFTVVGWERPTTPPDPTVIDADGGHYVLRMFALAVSVGALYHVGMNYVQVGDNWEITLTPNRPMFIQNLQVFDDVYDIADYWLSPTNSANIRDWITPPEITPPPPPPPPIIATLSDILIPINGGTVTINLTDGVFSPVLSGAWIINLPAGLTQGAVTRISDTQATITITGLATVISTAQINVTIPIGNVVSVTTAIPTVANANARYNIPALGRNLAELPNNSTIVYPNSPIVWRFINRNVATYPANTAILIADTVVANWRWGNIGAGAGTINQRWDNNPELRANLNNWWGTQPAGLQALAMPHNAISLLDNNAHTFIIDTISLPCLSNFITAATIENPFLGVNMIAPFPAATRTTAVTNPVPQRLWFTVNGATWLTPLMNQVQPIRPKIVVSLSSQVTPAVNAQGHYEFLS